MLEANYWSLGSDFRGCGGASYTLSYMSQMGGWAVLDYALRFDSPQDSNTPGFPEENAGSGAPGAQSGAFPESTADLATWLVGQRHFGDSDEP